jgi:BirA family biotin operon repressor/biotin-[acetyl-CoA-carboxylase] ligase
MDEKEQQIEDDVRTKILKRLKEHKITNEYISGELISSELNISRAAVWKHIDVLKTMGYQIDSVTNKGYKLLRSPDIIFPFELKSEPTTQIIGKEIFYYSTLSSTNKVARNKAEEDAPDGSIIIAETQGSGRGRRGRSWESPPGGLWFTIILKPKLAPMYAPIITLLTGIACANAINNNTRLETTLKWPNDVRIKGKKVCGVLTELSTGPDLVNYILVGLGINVNNKFSDFPFELQTKATTLKHELNRQVNRKELLKEFLSEFEMLYLPFTEEPQKQNHKIINMWCKISDTIGKDVVIETVSGSMSGVAVDISKNGSLVLENKWGKREEIIAGDCIYIETGTKK